jgi:bacillithiol system protein YtxJ
MDVFKFTSHLSEILESSDREPVVIFKYSNECGTSDMLLEDFLDYIKKKKSYPIYKVTVQTEPILSEKIADWFQIQHESPQVITISKRKVVYTGHHSQINLSKVFKQTKSR